MRFVIPFIKKIKKIECPDCKIELEFDVNVLFHESEEKNIFPYTNNAWFECPHCKKGYLVEDYTKKGKKGSIKIYLEKYNNFFNKLTKQGRDGLKKAGKVLINLK